MKFEYVNKNGHEQWWLDSQMVPQTVYELAFKSQYGLMTQDMNCVGFEDMIRFISDGDKVAYFRTPHKSYKFYAETDEEFNDVIIKVRFDDVDVEFGEFFHEHEQIFDWIDYKFIVKDIPKWVPCNFKQAHKYYESGMSVRCEVDGVVEEFMKTAHNLQSLVDVVSYAQLMAEWEYRQ